MKQQLTASVAFASLVRSALAAQTIRQHPDNPYWLEWRGKATVLITSAEHYGAVLNRDFDFRRYLETLERDGMNYTRIFAGSYVEPQGAFGIQRNTLAPAPSRFLAPWARSDRPGYAGGGDYVYNLALVPIRPLTALKAGENTFATVVAKGRMPDIYMPGVQVLIRYGSGEGGGATAKEMRAPAPLPVKGLQISQAADAVDVYDYLEVTIRPDTPIEGNPFTEVVVEGEFSPDKGGKPQKVDGFCDSATSSGMGRYMIPLLVPYLEPDENGTIQVEDLDLKALIDWHVANGYYSPDSYCMVVHAAWEVWILDQDLRTNDMAFVIKKKGQPAVTIPAWSSFVNKKPIEAKPEAPAGASTGSLPRLKVGPNRRFLVTADGRLFFWLGDTAWELFHRLTREEKERYLADRAAKGFNVIQTVARLIDQTYQGAPVRIVPGGAALAKSCRAVRPSRS